MTDQEWVEYRAKRYRALGNPPDDGRMNMVPHYTIGGEAAAHVSRRYVEQMQEYCSQPALIKSVAKARRALLRRTPEEQHYQKLGANNLDCSCGCGADSKEHCWNKSEWNNAD